MMTVKNYLDKSPIDGIGIYAGEDIEKGTIVWRHVEGLEKVITEAEYEKLPDLAKEYIDKYGFMPPSKPGIRVLEFDNGRFMNHAANPNTNFNDEMQGIATRDIKKGEEITCNYKEFCIMPHELW